MYKSSIVKNSITLSWWKQWWDNKWFPCIALLATVVGTMSIPNTWIWKKLGTPICQLVAYKHWVGEKAFDVRTEGSFSGSWSQVKGISSLLVREGLVLELFIQGHSPNRMPVSVMAYQKKKREKEMKIIEIAFPWVFHLTPSFCFV